MRRKHVKRILFCASIARIPHPAGTPEYIESAGAMITDTLRCDILSDPDDYRDAIGQADESFVSLYAGLLDEITGGQGFEGDIPSAETIRRFNVEIIAHYESRCPRMGNLSFDEMSEIANLRFNR